MTTKRPTEQAHPDEPRTAGGDRPRPATRVERLCANTARSLRPAAAGLELRCLSGLLVVTQSGDRDDHVLCPGDAFRTSSRGRVVAWALMDSGFTVRTDAGALGTRRAA